MTLGAGSFQCESGEGPVFFQSFMIGTGLKYFYNVCYRTQGCYGAILAWPGGGAHLGFWRLPPGNGCVGNAQGAHLNLLSNNKSLYTSILIELV